MPMMHASANFPDALETTATSRYEGIEGEMQALDLKLFGLTECILRPPHGRIGQR
jgi:hypothetical protein